MSKTYIFDLDGTLVSSVEYIRQTVSDYLANIGITLTDEVWSVLVSIGYENTAKYFIEHYNVKKSVKEIVYELQQNLIPKYANDIMLKENAKKYLDKLREEGAKMYILSASPLLFINPCLENNGVLNYFEEIISTDKYAPYTKLDEELYTLVLKDIGVNKSDVIYFEDSINPILTATKYGITVYAVKDLQPAHEFETIKNMATKTIYDFGELL